MKIKITCSCEKTLEIGSEFSKDEIVCQNCGAKFPDEVTAAAKKLFSGYSELCNAFYGLDGQGFEIIPENEEDD